MSFEGTDISDEEKATIVNDFIQQTPPGQFSYVLKDVRTLLDNDAILQSEGPKAFMKYHQDQTMPVSVEDEKVLVSHHGVETGGNLVAPESKRVFSYDPVRGEAKVVSSEVTDSSFTKFENYRSPMAGSIAKYVADHYAQGNSTVYAKDGTDGDNIVVSIIIESHQFEIRNYWTGNWRSSWTVKFNPNDKTAELSGVIKVQVHYFEEGNIQLITNKSSDVKVNFWDEQSLADEVAAKILDIESEYQTGISEAYYQFSSSTFKVLRRVLPVNQTKINWDQLAAYKIGAELKNL